jgi:hypothetical protein
MRRNRTAGLIACDVEGGDAGGGVALDELHGCHTLGLVKLAERAQDQARFDTGRAGTFVGCTLDGLDDALGRKAALDVKHGREAQLGVDDVVGGKLIEDICDDEAQRGFALHQLVASWGAGEKVGEICTARGRNKFAVVHLARE